MLTTHAARSATAPPIASCLFVFRVVGFIIDDLKKHIYLANQLLLHALLFLLSMLNKFYKIQISSGKIRIN